MYSWRESIDMCQRCKWRTYDMEGVYCAHPKSFEVAPLYGASTNRMTAEGLCTKASDDPSKNLVQLYEPKEL